jgi:GH25 family lysozyme M1 (1,4-beta-N-acetylmuramidase)
MSEPTLVTDPQIPDDFRPFRAGGQDAQKFSVSPSSGLAIPRTGDVHVAAAAQSARTYLADVSEFQPDIVDAAYLQWSKAIIIRAAYGSTHDDRAWYGGDRRAQLHKGGVKFLGIYQYLVAGQDPVVQAKELIRMVGPLQAGEKLICDLEEGSGNQHARLTAWYNTIMSAYPGVTPWTYSGLFFAASSGIAPVDWVAAYQSAEPSVPHKLWQFTDKLSVPGIGSVDCSVFNGTIDQLAAYGYQPGVTEGQFPIPAHLAAGAGVASLPVSWQPVKMADGTVPTGYTVEAWGLDNHVYAHMVVTGTSALLTGLHAGWTYKIRVWANGGKVSPQHAEITVQL